MRYVALAETAQADSHTDTVANTAADSAADTVADTATDTVADTAAYPNPQAHAAEITASGDPAERDR